ncbi:MAG: FecR family protein [Flavobacteriaceae bacterium]
MKNIREQIDVSKLLAGKVLGKLTPEQEAALQKWETEPENKILENNILNEQAFQHWQTQIAALDTKREWHFFLEHVQNGVSQKSRIVKLRILKWVSSVAAVFLLAFFVYFAYQNNIFNFNNSYKTVQETSIAPGTSQAELILSNGKVLSLQDTLEAPIKDHGTLANNAKGVLHYDKETTTEKIEPKTNTLRVPRGAEYQLVLTDGTKIWLNSDSELTYQVPFTDNQRRVTLKGEAYFNVAHDKDKPFIVSASNQDVQVLGTAFNISAYPENRHITTTLVEGRVKANFAHIATETPEYILTPNEQLVYKTNTKQITKQTVDVYPFVSWKDGRFVFKNEPLESFFKTLGKWYDVDVVITDESLKPIRFTGDLPRYNNMQNILKIVEAEMSVQIKVENNKTIYVSKQ